MEEDEEFYDSLDEDFEQETILSGATIPPSKISKIPIRTTKLVEDIALVIPLFKNEKLIDPELRNRKIFSTYGRELHKTAPLMSLQNENRCEKYLDENKLQQASLKQLNNTMPMPDDNRHKNINLTTSKRSASYLDKFRAKFDVPMTINTSDSTRALQDEHSFRSSSYRTLSSDKIGNSSCSDCYSDALSFISDSSSFYLNFLEQEKLRAKELQLTKSEKDAINSKRTQFSSQKNLNTKINVNERRNSNNLRKQTCDEIVRENGSSISLNKKKSTIAFETVNQNNEIQLNCRRKENVKFINNRSRASLITPFWHNLNSVSEYSVATTRSFKSHRTSNHSDKSTKSDRKSLEPIPKLGGLGPDTSAVREKLERLRRQQSYGKKVNSQNRMKIMETHILKKLKEELHKSNLIEQCTQKMNQS